MAYIENEKKFRQFMVLNGPREEKSQSNYISWLRFLSDNDFKIDSTLNDSRKTAILNTLRLTASQRSQYTREDDYSNFQSALNKYLKFVTSGHAPLLKDLAEIELVPKDPDVFQKELLRTKYAKRIFYLKNGEVIKQIWHASKLQSSSSLFFNIKTNATFRAKSVIPGIGKVHFEILEKGDVAQWLMQINA